MTLRAHDSLAFTSIITTYSSLLTNNMSQTRVIYKPDPNSTDEFILFALPGQVEKWRKGE